MKPKGSWWNVLTFIITLQTKKLSENLQRQKLIESNPLCGGGLSYTSYMYHGSVPSRQSINYVSLAENDIDI